MGFAASLAYRQMTESMPGRREGDGSGDITISY